MSRELYTYTSLDSSPYGMRLQASASMTSGDVCWLDDLTTKTTKRYAWNAAETGADDGEDIIRCDDNVAPSPGAWVQLKSPIDPGYGLEVGDIVTRFDELTTTEQASRRLLPIKGGTISRTSYAALFEEWGTKFGEGDGVNTFHVCDGRGRAFRQVDDGAGVDPDAASRTAQSTGGDTGDAGGTFQDDEFLSHTHSAPFSRGAVGTNLYPTTNTSGYSGLDGYHATTATGGNETRMKNVSVYRYVRY